MLSYWKKRTAYLMCRFIFGFNSAAKGRVIYVKTAEFKYF